MTALLLAGRGGKVQMRRVTWVPVSRAVTRRRGACMTTADTLDRGRESFERRAWADAFVQLSAADRETPLAPEDLERLATAAYLVGRDADSEEVWARAHHEWLRLGGAERAVRCAFWLALGLLSRASWPVAAAG